MTTLSPQQVYATLRAVGFDRESAIHMVAIAKRESNFQIEARANYPNGVGPGYGPEDSIGLYQVNMLAHPQYDAERLATDPLYAAQAAYEISGGGVNFNPWTTNRGLSDADLAAARKAADEVDTSGNMFDVLSSVPAGAGLAGSSTAAWAQGTLGDQGRANIAGVTDNSPAVQAFLAAVANDPDGLVKARFPSWSMYLQEPELGPILRQAATENWDTTRLTTAVQATNWYRTTSDSQRSWDSLANADPAAADRQRDDRRMDVQQQFAQVGYAPDHATLMRIVEDSLRNGWDSGRITSAIVAALPDHFNPQQVGAGDIGGKMADFKAAAASYFMPLTDDTAYDWAKRSTMGTMTDQGVKDQMLRWAKSNWSWMAPQLDQGSTVRDVFQPMAETIAGIMGVAPASIDLMGDSFWRQITGTRDAQGAARAPTIQDAEELARSHPGWRYTADGNNRTAGIANDLISTFTGA
jgi:hypothetical protein